MSATKAHRGRTGTQMQDLSASPDCLPAVLEHAGKVRKRSTNSSEITWLRSYFSGIPTIKFLFFLISRLYSLGGSYYAQTGLKDQGVLLPPIECGVPT